MRTVMCAYGRVRIQIVSDVETYTLEAIVLQRGRLAAVPPFISPNRRIRSVAQEEIAKLWSKPQPAAESLVAGGRLNIAPGGLVLWKDGAVPEQIEVPDEAAAGGIASRLARPEAPGFRIIGGAPGGGRGVEEGGEHTPGAGGMVRTNSA